VFSAYRQNLSAGGTCVRDSGSPGKSGAGCAVTAGAPTWLQYLWNSSMGSVSSPSAMATFGVFPAPASRIHQREVY